MNGLVVEFLGAAQFAEVIVIVQHLKRREIVLVEIFPQHPARCFAGLETGQV